MSNVSIERGGVVAGVADYIAHVFADFAQASRNRAAYRKTYAELRSLSDRDLADLGISRGEIERVSREAVYGYMR